VLADYAKARAKKLGLKDLGVRINMAGCLGQCAAGPVAVVYPESVWYTCKTEQDVDAILEQHVIGGKVVSHLLMNNEKIS